MANDELQIDLRFEVVESDSLVDFLNKCFYYEQNGYIEIKKVDWQAASSARFMAVYYK